MIVRLTFARLSRSRTYRTISRPGRIGKEITELTRDEAASDVDSGRCRSRRTVGARSPFPGIERMRRPPRIDVQRVSLTAAMFVAVFMFVLGLAPGYSTTDGWSKFTVCPGCGAYEPMQLRRTKPRQSVLLCSVYRTDPAPIP